MLICISSGRYQKGVPMKHIISPFHPPSHQLLPLSLPHLSPNIPSFKFFNPYTANAIKRHLLSQLRASEALLSIVISSIGVWGYVPATNNFYAFRTKDELSW